MCSHVISLNSMFCLYFSSGRVGSPFKYYFPVAKQIFAKKRVAEYVMDQDMPMFCLIKIRFSRDPPYICGLNLQGSILRAPILFRIFQLESHFRAWEAFPGKVVSSLRVFLATPQKVPMSFQ